MKKDEEALSEPKNSFVDSFTITQLMGKKDLANLCEKSEMWIHKHKTEFE